MMAEGRRTNGRLGLDIRIIDEESKRTNLKAVGWCADVITDVLFGDESGTTRPVCGRFIEYEEHLKLGWFFLGEFHEFVVEKDVLLSNVGKDESDLCIVLWIVEN